MLFIKKINKIIIAANIRIDKIHEDNKTKVFYKFIRL